MSVLATVLAPTIREQLERLAYWWVWDRLTDAAAVNVLVRLQDDGKIPAGLNGGQLGDHFADLVLGINQRDGVENGETHPDEIDPELRGDDLAALAQAEQRITDALDALTGGTP